jgi:predicted secreted acid phosphatase
MVSSRNPHLLVIALCAALAAASNAAAAEPADNLLCPAPQTAKALEEFHDCAAGAGCYPLETERRAAAAMRYLDYRIEHPRYPGERLAITVDIDETALSNYAFLKESHFTYNRAQLQQWWQKEQDPALPGTLALVKRALSHHVAVFFISGRSATYRKYTEGNLQGAGYPLESIKANGAIILKAPPADPKNPCAYKTAHRRAIAQRGFTIVLNVGDQYSDLEECDGQGRALTGVISFRGERLVKLPNPFYCIP